MIFVIVLVLAAFGAAHHDLTVCTEHDLALRSPHCVAGQAAEHSPWRD